MDAPASFVTDRLRAERFTSDHVDELALLDTDEAVAASNGAIALGYALKPEFWGVGYATELTRKLVDIARGFGAPIVAWVLEAHTPSRKVLEKAGLIDAGVNADDPETVLYRLRTST